MRNLPRLADAFDAARMDALLLMAPTATATGYSGRGDFSMNTDGRLTRRGERASVPFVYAGAAVLTPAFFAGVAPGPSSMSPLFDRAARPAGFSGCSSTASGCMSARPTRSPAAEAKLLATRCARIALQRGLSSAGRL